LIPLDFLSLGGRSRAVFRFLLVFFCAFSGLHADLLVSKLESLDASEADAIIQARETAKADHRAARIVELEKAIVKSEGRGVLPSGQEVVIREVEPPQSVAGLIHRPVHFQALPTETLSPELLVKLQALQARAEKEHVVLMLSATVYDHSVTRLSWRTGKIENIAFTNADFNFLRGVHSIQTEIHDFTFFMGIGNASAENNPYRDETVPDASAFFSERSEYAFVSGDAENDAVFAGIEALLEHYDANLPVLKIEHQRREALSAAKKRYDTAHPKAPEPFIMQFWTPVSTNRKATK